MIQVRARTAQLLGLRLKLSAALARIYSYRFSNEVTSFMISGLRVGQQAQRDLHGPRRAAEGLRPLERVRLCRHKSRGQHDQQTDPARSQEDRQVADLHLSLTAIERI